MASTERKSFVGHIVDDRYEVHAELGEGAVGMVYRAMDREREQPVALKIWHDSARDTQTRGRFIREAKALSVLRHPNIVEVFGYGVVDGSPYVAMEMLAGETLDDVIGDGDPMHPHEAFEIFFQVLGALAFAHSQNVVHRDLKPENIFLVPGPDGKRQVRILDYGLAKFLAPDDDPLKGHAITMTGMVMGTPLYMPPEQAAGQPIDLRADVYSAGCIFFEMLTGRLPYLGESQIDLLRMHLQAPIPKIAEALEGKAIDPALQQVIDTALAKKPEGRFPSAGEMLQALKRLGPRAVGNAAPPPRQRPARGDDDPVELPASASKGTMLYIGVAAAVLVLAVVFFAMMK